MHFIAVSVLAFSILFSNASYTQDLTNTKDLAQNGSDTRATKQREGKKKPQRNRGRRGRGRQEKIVFAPLSGASPFPNNTFETYTTREKVDAGVMEWNNRYQVPQEKYKVSLVGVNINTWLENPRYFNILKKAAEKVSIKPLLDNLQANNPNLVFNSPAAVRKALTSDIYSPYLKIIPNYTDKNVRFADTKEAISYTRHYHIYGVTAGGLPYFGRPMEGGKREINLGVLPGQFDEITARLPDTDIFLVAMINVTPNWLEEGMNLFHKSQQELEILVYAFDRKGKLLGGAGVPMDFVHEGQYFVMEQKIRSLVWQEGVSRAFYMWASFRMLNDEDKTQEPAIPNITVPPNTWPSLNKKQKYILASIKDLRANKKSFNVELFSPDGDTVFDPEKFKETKKIVLANRILLHKESELLVQNPKTNETELLAYNDIMGRFQNFNTRGSKKVDTSTKAILTTKMLPSNEGKKLTSILQYGLEMLVKSPISHSNELYYTNEVDPYELEADPLIYASERNKWVLLQNNLKEFAKAHKKTTKDFLKKEKLKTKDKIFWNEFTIKRLEDQELATKEMEEALKNWKKSYSSLENIKNNIYKIDRQLLIYTDQEKKFSELKERNVQFLNEKYVVKTNTLSKKIAKLDVKAEKYLDKIVSKQKNEKTIERRALLQQEYDELLKQEQNAFKTMTAMFPPAVNYMKNINKDDPSFIDIADIVLNDDKNVKAIAELNGVTPELVAVARSIKDYSPMQKYNDKNKKKTLRAQRKKEKMLYFEGFLLGLTRAWKTKTTLSDRLEYL